MCCRTVHDGVTYKPGDFIPVRSVVKPGRGKWAGFARSETAEAVLAQFDIELDVPAEKFAENNKHTGDRTFGDLPEGHVIRAIGNRRTGHIKILTRDADALERQFYGHNRLPVTGPARF